MFGRNGIAVIGAVGALLFVTQADAQKLYRCGNTSQDRPCDAGRQGRVVGSAGAQSPAASARNQDPACTQRGADALKIIWSREGGATKERQLAETDRKGLSAAKREEEIQLIESVYRKRGSAPDIRAAVEAECVAEKERAAQAAALAAAAARLQGGTPAAPTAVPGGPSEAELRAAETRRREEAAASEEESRKSRCADLVRQNENIRRQERAGGSGATMDRLYEQRRDVEARMSREGC